MDIRLLRSHISLMHINRVSLNKNWNFTNVISPFYRIYLIDIGSGYITDSLGTLALEPGYMYIIPSFTLHDVMCPEYLSQYFIHFFEYSPNGITLFHDNRKVFKIKAGDLDIQLINRLIDINPGRGILGSDNPKVYEKENIFRDYQKKNEIQTEAIFTETQGILLQLIARFMDSEYYKIKSNTPISSKVSDTINYIQLNIDKILTISELSKRVNLSEDYFSRIFLRNVGTRPLAYLQEKKIERAQYLFITTNMQVSEIAYKTGFDSVAYFSKIFKRLTSMTPMEYRNQSHKLNILSKFTEERISSTNF